MTLKLSILSAAAAALIFVATAVNASHQVPGSLETIAGAGTELSDGSPATDRRIPFASDLAIAPDGGVVVADVTQCAIRKIDGDVITTIAGVLSTWGGCGHSGDGGPATAAEMVPRAMAYDSAGNLFIADTFNCSIRRVDAATQIITHFAGGTCGARDDNGTPAEDAWISNPMGIAVAADGDVYFTEPQACRVSKITGDTHVMMRVTGSQHGGICFHGGDGGPALDGRVSYPQDIVIDEDENVYIADWGACRIRMISGGLINTIAGTGLCTYNGDGPALSRHLRNPFGIALDAGSGLLIADSEGCLIRRLKDGVLTTLAGYIFPIQDEPGFPLCGFNGDDQQAMGTMLRQTLGVAGDANGNAYFSESDFTTHTEPGRIRIIYDIEAAAATPTATATVTNSPTATATHSPTPTASPTTSATATATATATPASSPDQGTNADDEPSPSPTATQTSLADATPPPSPVAAHPPASTEGSPDGGANPAGIGPRALPQAGHGSPGQEHHTWTLVILTVVLTAASAAAFTAAVRRRSDGLTER